MKVLNNTIVDRLQGYLEALDDINGGQREFTTVVTLISSKEDNLLTEIKTFSKNIFMENPRIIKRKNYKNLCGIDSFLNLLLFSKPFSGLYRPWDTRCFSKKVFKAYKDYCLAHISDYIDFAFNEAGMGKRELERDVELLLLNNKNQYFITIVLKYKNIKMLLFFYKKLFSKDDFIELFNMLSKQYPSVNNKDKIH